MFSLSKFIIHGFFFYILSYACTYSIYNLLLGHLQQGTKPVSGGGTQNTSSKGHSQSGVPKRPYAHLANDNVHSVDVPSAVNSEQTEEKRTGKRKKGASFMSCTDKSASSVTVTGGIQTRQMRTRKT
jgi:hypothetical protein